MAAAPRCIKSISITCALLQDRTGGGRFCCSQCAGGRTESGGHVLTRAREEIRVRRKRNSLISPFGKQWSAAAAFAVGSPTNMGASRWAGGDEQNHHRADLRSVARRAINVQHPDGAVRSCVEKDISAYHNVRRNRGAASQSVTSPSRVQRIRSKRASAFVDALNPTAGG